MNVAMAIWGALCSAETEIWDGHLDELLTLFLTEYRRSGGAELDVETVRRQLMLYAAIMGLAWLLDSPAYIAAHVPDLAEIEGRFDPRIKHNEAARAQLQMMTNFLNLWETKDFGRILDEFINHEQEEAAS